MSSNKFHPGQVWLDNNGQPINAHGGGFLQFDRVWYWYGEHKIAGEAGNFAHVGVHVYHSDNLYQWIDDGIAFDIRQNPEFFPPGKCIIERPKVLFCRATGKFVMWFHYEPDTTYRMAAAGMAVSDTPIGPFRFVRTCRPNPGVWAENTPEMLRNEERVSMAVEYLAQRDAGLVPELPSDPSFLGASVPRGQESRDMTLFLDNDGQAYHIYSSEHNQAIHIAELTGDFLGHTGRYWRTFENRMMEAPAVFSHQGKYYFIASGCSGWFPNAARSAVAENIIGPWMEMGNPAVDAEADTTYSSQSSYILQAGQRFIYVGDRWNPQNAINGRYVWLPIDFENGRPVIHWHDEWNW